MLTLQEFIPLASFTSFKVGGLARFFCEPQSITEIQEAMHFAHSQEMPFWVLGRGSHVVISDHGLPGLVIRLGNSFANIQVHKNLLVAESGALLNTVVNHAIRANLGGIEKLGGIPGTLGGAVFINAGAYGQEIGPMVLRVESLTFQGEPRIRLGHDCDFSYRHSYYCDVNEVITRVELQLPYEDGDSLRSQMHECLRQRRDKQPLELPNAGSMFKRPPGHFAGALIESSGLKGFTVGGAQISTKHAGFVVNTGGATASDIWNLTEKVMEHVEKDHGIRLQREVLFLGEVP